MRIFLGQRVGRTLRPRGADHSRHSHHGNEYPTVCCQRRSTRGSLGGDCCAYRGRRTPGPNRLLRHRHRHILTGNGRPDRRHHREGPQRPQQRSLFSGAPAIDEDAEPGVYVPINRGAHRSPDRGAEGPSTGGDPRGRRRCSDAHHPQDREQWFSGVGAARSRWTIAERTALRAPCVWRKSASTRVNQIHPSWCQVHQRPHPVHQALFAPMLYEVSTRVSTG